MAQKTTWIYGQGLRYRDQLFELDLPNIPIYLEVPGGPESLAGFAQPRRRAVTLRFYDREDLLRAVISSNAGACPILALSWEDLDTGCGSFDLTLATDYGIGHGWRMDLHLWNNPVPSYCGFVQGVPLDGGTERSFKYQGYGGLGLLDGVLVTEKFAAGQPVHSIVLALARLSESQLKKIQVLPSQVRSTQYKTSGELNFLRTPVKEAIKQASELAGDFQWGIDAQRRFFFAPQSNLVDYHGWVGKHLTTYEPREDSSLVANAIYTKFGKSRTDLDPSHPLYKTNWLEDVVQDAASQALYGVQSAIYTAPSSLNQVDAYRGAGEELRRRKDPRRYARVAGLQFTGTSLPVTGLARIVGKGGTQLVLRKKRLSYSLDNGRINVTADFGDIDYAASEVLASLTANQAAESLARQNAQRTS
jgi:hypothetical protein